MEKQITKCIQPLEGEVVNTSVTIPELCKAFWNAHEYKWLYNNGVLMEGHLIVFENKS
jgi:hypothetical protein